MKQLIIVNLKFLKICAFISWTGYIEVQIAPYIHFFHKDLLVQFMKLRMMNHGDIKGLKQYILPITIMILSFRTDRSGQTVQTQIRLLKEEQSDQGLHCLLFHWYILD